MLRFILAGCFVVLTSVTNVARAADNVPSPLARWKSEITLQLDAAQADLTIQQQIAEVTEDRYRRGDVGRSELQYAQESELQATEWVELLRSEAAAIELNTVAGDHADRYERVTHLRVPGLPLLFSSDDFAWIELPQSPQAMRIVNEIQYLDQELHETCVPALQSDELQVQIDRLKSIEPSTPEIRLEIESLTLHRRAARLDPERLADILRCSVIQSRIPDADNGYASTSMTKDGIVAVAERWTKRTRQIVLTQTERALEHLLDRSTSEDSTGGHETQLQQLAMLQDLADRLRRDLMFLRERDSSVTQSVITQLHSRAGYLMRVMKTRWEQVKDHERAAGDTSLLPPGAGQLLQASPLMTHELQVAEAQLKFAMELYRLESGRNDDPSLLFEHRSQIFELATNLQAEKRELNSHVQALQHIAATGRETLTSSPGQRQESHTTSGELQQLQALQQRLLIREKRAKLCFKLARMANDRQAVAHYEY